MFYHDPGNISLCNTFRENIFKPVCILTQTLTFYFYIFPRTWTVRWGTFLLQATNTLLKFVESTSDCSHLHAWVSEITWIFLVSPSSSCSTIFRLRKVCLLAWSTLRSLLYISWILNNTTIVCISCRWANVLEEKQKSDFFHKKLNPNYL